MMEMEDNSEDVIEDEDNKDSMALNEASDDSCDEDNDINDTENVCELEGNQLSSVVPNLITSSGECSNDDTDSQHLLNEDNITQNVKIVKVVPLPHARSEVWSYFGFIADDEGEIQDKKKAICKICASTLAYSGNTTNLFTHLKAMHPEAQPQKLAPTNRTPRTGKKSGKRRADVLDSPSGPLIVRAITYSQNENLFDDYNPQTGALLTPKSLVKSQNTYNSSSSLADINTTTLATDDITNAIVNFLVKDYRPISVVEGKGFQEMIQTIAPGYVVPDTRRLTTAVKKRYDEHRRDLILRAMQDE